MRITISSAGLLVGVLFDVTTAFAPAFGPVATRTSLALDALTKKTEADKQFKSLTRGFNQRWIADKCQDVYLIKTTEDAREALDRSIADHYDVTTRGGIKIKSGGHCYEDFVTNEDTQAILDVSPMKDWGYDDSLDEGGFEKGWYLSAGDTNWGAFEKLYKEENKILPGGSCYSVGLGGHISGGGDGIMSRLHGCTIDVLTGVEIIVKDEIDQPARVLYVGDNSTDPDEKALYWAQRGGGGGNFGIITKYYFKTLPDAPVGAIMSQLAFNWDYLTEENLGKILDWYVAFASKNDNRASSGKFPISHKAAGEAVMLLHTAYHSDAERIAAIAQHHEWEQEIRDLVGEQAVSAPKLASAGHGVGFARVNAPRKVSFRDAKMRTTEGEEVSDTLIDLPFYDSTQTMNPSGSTQRGKYKSAYMLKKFPEDQISIMYEWLTKVPTDLSEAELKQSLIQVDCFGGRINDFESYETPIAQRSYVVKCQYQTYWSDEQKDNAHLGWIQGFYNAMYSTSGGCPDPAYVDGEGDYLYEGCYYNYPDIDLNNLDGGVDKALELYFLDNYKTNNIPNDKHNLSYVKGRWDPYNIFHHKQSIPVPANADPYAK